MENSKPTKRTLVTGVLAVVLCVAMLVGTTFAWFTDTASTGVNTIKSGNLDVDLEYATAWDDDGTPTAWESAQGKTLNFRTADNRTADILWEPGCTYRLPELRVINNGNLALKYKLVITGIDGDAELNDVIEWSIKLDDAVYSIDGEHSLAAKSGSVADSDVLTVSGHMMDTADNNYMDLEIRGIGITVYATQDTVENDSFGNDYDEDAEYDSKTVFNVSDVESLKDAAKNVQAGDVIMLCSDLTVSELISFPVTNFTFDGQGHTLTADRPSDGFSGVLKFGETNKWCVNMVVKNLNVVGSAGIAMQFQGGTSSTLENVNMNGDFNIAINFYGTHGAVMNKCNISSTHADKYCKSSIFANQQSSNQLILNKTTVDSVFVNATDTDYPTGNDGIKLVVNSGSNIQEVHTNGGTTRTFYKVNGGTVGTVLADVTD